MGPKTNLVLVGSHLGYPMERTPLGGGAMVGLQLARLWAREPRVSLSLLGSGSQPPVAGVPYFQYPRLAYGPGKDPDLVGFSELEYALFCRRFEAETTRHLLLNEARLDPRRTVVLVNDISESPDLPALARCGYRIMSLWHVDVVEFFNRIYLREVLAPERLTRGFDRLSRLGLGWLVPDVLKLVFRKQEDAVAFSHRLVLPSRQMAETLRRCYAHLPRNGGEALADRQLVVPWGGWAEGLPEAEVAAEASRLREHYQLSPQSRVLMTLSRISPEKGIHLLLEALRLLERSPESAGLDVCLFVCGEAAFMRGKSYERRVRRAAERLRRFRIFFPGYLPAFEKQAYFRLAQLFVSPSVHESYGLTLVEAMRAGLPVLASDHYGGDEILRPEFGRTVSYRRRGKVPGLLAAALGELLREPGSLRRMGELAAARATGMTFAKAAGTLLEAASALACA